MEFFSWLSNALQQPLTPVAGFTIIAIVFGGLFALIFFLNRSFQKNAVIWELLMKGVYAHVEYGERVVEKRSGAMAHTTHRFKIFATAIFFADGRTCVLRGLYSIEFPSGTSIKIFRNKNGDYHIEKITS